MAIGSIIFQGKFCPLISDAVEQHMKSPKLDMWDRLLEQFGTMVREAEGMYLTKTSCEYGVLSLIDQSSP